jgi:hypothetical protein
VSVIYIVTHANFNDSCNSDPKLGAKPTFCCCPEQLGIKIFVMIFSVINLGIIAVGKLTLLRSLQGSSGGIICPNISENWPKKGVYRP